jgi:hypothetical protein
MLRLDEVARTRRGLVVWRGFPVQALGSGGRWPSRDSTFTQGATQTTVRTPRSRKRPTIPSKSGNWCGFGSQVLYWVSQGESIAIASSGIWLSA